MGGRDADTRPPAPACRGRHRRSGRGGRRRRKGGGGGNCKGRSAQRWKAGTRAGGGRGRGKSTVTPGADAAQRKPRRPFRSAPTVAAAKSSALSPLSSSAPLHSLPLRFRHLNNHAQKPLRSHLLPSPHPRRRLCPPRRSNLPRRLHPHAPPSIRRAMSPSAQSECLNRADDCSAPAHVTAGFHMPLRATRLLGRCVTLPRARRGPFPRAQGRTAPPPPHPPATTPRDLRSLPLKQPSGHTPPGQWFACAQHAVAWSPMRIIFDRQKENEGKKRSGCLERGDRRHDGGSRRQGGARREGGHRRHEGGDRQERGDLWHGGVRRQGACKRL